MQRKLGMPELKKKTAEIERINKEYIVHNPIALTNVMPGGDPKKFDGD